MPGSTEHHVLRTSTSPGPGSGTVDLDDAEVRLMDGALRIAAELDLAAHDVMPPLYRTSELMSIQVRSRDQRALWCGPGKWSSVRS